MANTQNLDLVKPLGTDHALVSVLNSNSDKIDAYAGAVNAGLDGLRDGLGILANGNTHAAITSGQFVYVKNHQTLPEGLYQATTNIAANGTLSTSNLTADPKGGLNTLSEQIGNKTNYVEISSGSLLTAIDNMDIGVVVCRIKNNNVSDKPINYRGMAIASINTSDEKVITYYAVNGAMYINHQYGGAWTGWEQLVLNSNIKKYSGVKTTDANGQVALAFSDLGVSARPTYISCTSYMPDVFCEYIYDNSSSNIVLCFNDKNGKYANTPVRFSVIAFD